MKVNGEAIYDTTASPFAQLKWGRATRKGQDLYLAVFDWPQDGKLVVPLKNQVGGAKLLAGDKTLKATSGENGVTIELPAVAPDPVASVIKLSFTGEPQVIPSVNTEAP